MKTKIPKFIQNPRPKTAKRKINPIHIRDTHLGFPICFIIPYCLLSIVSGLNQSCV